MLGSSLPAEGPQWMMEERPQAKTFPRPLLAMYGSQELEIWLKRSRGASRGKHILPKCLVGNKYIPLFCISISVKVILFRM